MDFKNYQENSKKLGISGGYFKLEAGENKIRIVSECEPSISHFIDKKPETCTQQEDCQYCKQGLSKSCKILVYVLDRADEEIKLAELPWSIYKALGQLANSSEYGFEGLPPYDIVITRTGEGMETRYSLLPGKNEKPITKEQEEDLKGRKKPLEIIAERLGRQENIDPNMPF